VQGSAGAPAPGHAQIPDFIPCQRFIAQTVRNHKKTSAHTGGESRHFTELNPYIVAPMNGR
jgi:hypothetical protein